MGNSTSKAPNDTNPTQEFKHFYDIIDFIASNYILTMNFKSLSNLAEKDYCNKLVILTSDIIKNHFDEAQITYLAQRIKDGSVVNEMAAKKVTFVNKNILDNLDASNDKYKSITKKRMCIGIAKFYVKIAHIFAAIVMTINPVYTYKDTAGNIIKSGLLEKDKIPKNTQRKLDKFNICDNRIKSLKTDMVIDDVSKEATIHPKICGINIDKKTNQPKNLIDEPGIKELFTLYLDDEYDYSTGKFKGMSAKTNALFMKDLTTFYAAFTGNANMPSSITKFSDIKLRDYNNKPGCQSTNGILKQPNKISTTDELFVQYAQNINNMINNAAKNQQKLLSVINTLFSFTTDPYTQQKKVRINPSLTELTLQDTIGKTRKLIVDLYIRCELDYVNGIKIYETIVEKKILETTQNQIKNLKIKSAEIINSTKTITSSQNNISSTIPPPIAPIQAPIQSPIIAPIIAPIQAPIQSPITEPIVEPIQAPIPTPITAPIQAPIQAPITAPIPAPITEPIIEPIQAPIIEPIPTPH